MIRSPSKSTIALVAAFGLASTALLAPVALAQEDEAVFDGAINSTVRVRSLSTGRYGTGWVIAAADNANRAGAAVIVTSLNTIEGSSVVVVREPNESVDRDATILATDTDRNLALLEVKDIAAKNIALTRTPPKVGRSVWATGYSLPADAAEGWRLAVNATIKGGRLGREYRGPITTEARADTNQIEHDAAMVRGYEGGPLLDKCGRVIGVNMKSGGQVVPRKMMLIEQTAGIMNALRADEVIAFAKSRQVEPEIIDGEECAGAAAAPVPAAASSAAPAAVAPVKPATSSGGSFLNNPLVLGLLVLAGIGLAIFGFMAMSRKPRQAAPQSAPQPAPSSAPPEPRAGTALASDDSTVLLAPRKGTTRQASLNLSGRGPDGEAINLQFASDALATTPAMLGVGANADAKVPDNRKEYKVSRMHARIGFDGSSFTIEDNKSLNGTKLNGKPLEAHQATAIMNGDTIMLADVELRVSIG